MANDKAKGFILHDELIVDLLESGFTPEDIGVLVIAITQYRMGNDLPEMDKAVKGVWNTKVKKLIDIDNEKYQAVCERNKKNIEKRWSDTKSVPEDTNAIPNNTTRIPDDTKGVPEIPIRKEQIANSNTTSNEVVVKPRKSRPESSAEVSEYRLSLGYKGFEAERFFDYYEANGWVQGRGKPIKDWKAAVRNWHKNDYKPKAKDDWLEAIERGVFDG
jgi:hypothetical protein